MTGTQRRGETEAVSVIMKGLASSHVRLGWNIKYWRQERSEGWRWRVRGEHGREQRQWVAVRVSMPQKPERVGGSLKCNDLTIL